MNTPLTALSTLLCLSLAACASAPPPKPAAVETTAADVAPSREAFTPPDQWEMKIADKPVTDTNKEAPAGRVQADTTSGKRQPGGLVTLPGKPKPSTK